MGFHRRGSTKLNHALAGPWQNQGSASSFSGNDHTPFLLSLPTGPCLCSQRDVHTPCTPSISPAHQRPVFFVLTGQQKSPPPRLSLAPGFAPRGEISSAPSRLPSGPPARPAARAGEEGRAALPHPPTGIFHEANGRADRAAAARSARTRARLWREERIANGRAVKGPAGQW